MKYRHIKGELGRIRVISRPPSMEWLNKFLKAMPHAMPYTYDGNTGLYAARVGYDVDNYVEWRWD